MMHPIRTAMTMEEMRDAGLLRQRVAAVYGQVLTEGGNTAIYFHAMRLVQRLARMSGVPIEKVLADLRADYEGGVR